MIVVVGNFGPRRGTQASDEGGGNGGVGVGSRCGAVHRRSWEVGSPMQGVVVGTREQGGGVLVFGPCSQPVCTHPV